MWVAKFKIWHKGCLLRPICVKYKVTDLVYLINFWKEKGYFYYTELHILQGKEENKRGFIKLLKKEKSTVKLEQKGNYVFTLNRKELKDWKYSPVFDPRLIYVKPVAQRSDGFEDWEVACWDRALLMEIRKVSHFKIKKMSIENKKLEYIFMPHIYPKITEKQKEALELAVKEGYYDFPRKIHLEKLAKISKVRMQTFQETLRRAEKKLVPFLTERVS